ncbi:MAG: lytic transglycosylase domain-containing protein [Alphaproteobacteria bacterium]|nr:lytic transglycosylase domain-containing protein [Alphaproteobacteria bacterium]
MSLSAEDQDVFDTLLTLSPRATGAYLRSPQGNRAAVILSSFDKELKLEDLVNALEHPNTNVQYAACSFIDEAFDAHAHQQCDTKHEQKTSRFEAVRTELALAGKRLINLARTVMHRDYSGTLKQLAVASVALPTEILAAGLSAMGLSRRERTLAIANVSAWSAYGLTQSAVVLAFLAAGTAPSEAALPRADITPTPTGLTQQFSPAVGAATAVQNSQAQMTPSETLLSPHLIRKMNRDPLARQYVAWIRQACERVNIDWKICANQLFRESAHFNTDVIRGKRLSPAGAVGIAQFMPATGRTYGLNSHADLSNPRKAINAFAEHMRDLMKEYNGDIKLALMAYNGGRGAVNFVRAHLGSDANGAQALNLLQDRFNERGRTSPSAYHVETRAYVGDITGFSWDDDYRKWAQKMNANITVKLTHSF